jgi:hypothetical protein
LASAHASSLEILGSRWQSKLESQVILNTKYDRSKVLVGTLKIINTTSCAITENDLIHHQIGVGANGSDRDDLERYMKVS